MKILRLILLVLILLAISVLPSVVTAATSVTVTIVATPGANGGVQNFVATYISDTQIDLTWNKFGNAVNVMVRAKYGEFPADIPDENTAPTDGYLVYYGALEAISDTTMNFDESAGILYYKAWAQKADGKWYTGSVTDWKESEVMALIAFIILALVPTIATFALKSGKRILGVVSSGTWMILSAYCYTKYVALWDVYYALFWLSAVMVLAMILVPNSLKENKDNDVDMLEGFDEADRPLAEDIWKSEKDRDNYNRLFGKRKIGDKTLRVKRPSSIFTERK